MSNHRLQSLVNPASIAVLGASQKSGTVGNEVIVNLRKGGFEGPIHPINPGYEEVEGFTCYPTLTDLPEQPEMVIFAISDQCVETALDEVIALGIPACTIFSALIVNNDSTPNLKQRISDKAQAAGLLIAGANGMGFYNVRDRVLAGGFDTRDHPFPGNVTLISQSGAGMSGIVDCEQRIQFNFAVSSGYELTVAMEDYLDYALDLPETRVVGLFLETSRYPDKLIQAFKKANQRNIPIVVLKVGRTELAAELAVSHSGALAGSDQCYHALFHYYGVQRVEDLDQLATALIMFAQANQTAAGGLVCLHDSGGERQLIIDLADRFSVPLTELQNKTLKQLEGLLDPGLPVVNPLDGWGTGGADAPTKMAACFTTLLMDSGAAFGAVVHDRGPNSEIYEPYLDYLHQAQSATSKPVFLVANRQGSGSDELAITSTHQGFPVIDGISQFLMGARCLLDYRDFQQREPSQVDDLDQDKSEYWRERLRVDTKVSETLASLCLADMGIPMLQSVLVSSQVELQSAATAMGFPLVLKTAQPGIDHKSDVGGVILNIPDEARLLDAYYAMAERLGPQAMIAPMVHSGGIEMILGVSRDDQFGPTVVVGFGGLYAEVLADVAVLMPPFDSDTVKRALQNLAMYELLEGVRGAPAMDVDSYCRAAATLSQVALSLQDTVAEIDINPLKLSADGCIGVDALMVLIE
ncbi:MAG TPA: CoA-binding protein [Porticoccaceae bacterium]|nr:CoA-binding protein [Porticoccaceae bacterium]HIK81024.1 CoA-binding protein [Porticoccaceae bacterium]